MKATIWQQFVLLFIFTVIFNLNDSHAASKVRLEGELEVMVEDYADGRHKIRNYLKTDKKRIELTGALPKKLKSGDKIRVRGTLKNNLEMLVESGSTEILAVAALSGAIGEQRLAVFLVNFIDDTSQPISAASAQTLIFTTMNNYFKETSFQQTSVAGDVLGYFTVSVSKTNCDTYAIACEAAALAQAAGVNLSNYTRRMYMFPRNTGCAWAGLANVGGFNTNAWINGSFNLLVVGHEFGHNLGLHHAQALNCDVAPLGNTCSNLTYGDVADIMGNNKAGHFNAFEKERLGWMGASQILTATSSNRFFIEPYSSSNRGPKAVRIPRGNGDSFYLEYRQLIGFDSTLTAGNLTTGVMVRMVTAANPYQSSQLDMSPGTSTSTYTEFYDGALKVGQTFSDSGVSMTLVSADATGAVIDVNFGSAPQDTTSPNVLLTSPTSGSTVSNSITLSANASDNVAVSSVRFFVDGAHIGTDSSAPYAISYDSKLLSNGSHSFVAQAVDSSNNQSLLNQVTANVSNTVTPPPPPPSSDTIVPVVSIASPLAGSIVAARSTVSISGSASDNVAVTRMEAYVNGALICSSPNSSISCLWKTPGGKTKSHTVNVRAYDAAGNAGNKSVNISVAGTTGKGK